MLEINARSFEVNKRSVDYTKTGLICSLCRSQANNARSLHVKSYNVECTLVMTLLFFNLISEKHYKFICRIVALLIVCSSDIVEYLPYLFLETLVADSRILNSICTVENTFIL